MTYGYLGLISADKFDTIFYISNGKMPKRNPAYDWTKTVPGNSSETLWDTYYKTEELPQVISPVSGFVYNANHSPFKSSGIKDNPNPKILQVKWDMNSMTIIGVLDFINCLVAKTKSALKNSKPSSMTTPFPLRSITTMLISTRCLR